jgi:sigma-B regulation protein RsbU (phosphoserine phosphatase)
VSGHGVSSGVLMAMLKSATRMSLRQNSIATKMLSEVNQVFYSLKAPNAFATFAAISCTEQSGLEVLVAGHLPVLHCDGRELTELDTPGLPVGILPDADFRAVTVELSGGDVLAIVTDGLTEVFNSADTELGVAYIKATLLRECDRPLEQIANSLLAQAEQWGPRSDDQSLLLVRRLPNPQSE